MVKKIKKKTKFFKIKKKTVDIFFINNYRIININQLSTSLRQNKAIKISDTKKKRKEKKKGIITFIICTKNNPILKKCSKSKKKILINGLPSLPQLFCSLFIVEIMPIKNKVTVSSTLCHQESFL